jgi:hypothetical protein
LPFWICYWIPLDISSVNVSGMPDTMASPIVKFALTYWPISSFAGLFRDAASEAVCAFAQCFNDLEALLTGDPSGQT